MGSTLECPHCGASFYILPGQRPVRHVTRDADRFNPQTFMVISADNWLLHRCVLA